MHGSNTPLANGHVCLLFFLGALLQELWAKSEKLTGVQYKL